MSSTNRLKRLEEKLARKPSDLACAERSPEHDALIAQRLNVLQPAFDAAADRLLEEFAEECGREGDDLSPLAKKKAEEFVATFRRSDGNTAGSKPKRRR